MRYVIARYNSTQREEAYRIYITDGLQAITGADVRFYDLIQYNVTDGRTGDEVAVSVIQKANLNFKVE